SAKLCRLVSSTTPSAKAGDRTRSLRVPIPNMAPLTNQKHEAFVRNVLKTPKTKWSQAQCYEAAGYRSSGHGSAVLGSRLLKKVEIMNRVQELGRPAVRNAQVTLQSLLVELDRTIADARADKSHSAVVAALGLVTKIASMLHERADHDSEFGGAKSSA